MSAEMQQSKEPVSALLAAPYGHRLHPLLGGLFAVVTLILVLVAAARGH